MKKVQPYVKNLILNNVQALRGITWHDHSNTYVTVKFIMSGNTQVTNKKSEVKA